MRCFRNTLGHSSMYELKCWWKKPCLKHCYVDNRKKKKHWKTHAVLKNTSLPVSTEILRSCTAWCWKVCCEVYIRRSKRWWQLKAWALQGAAAAVTEGQRWAAIRVHVLMWGGWAVGIFHQAFSAALYIIKRLLREHQGCADVGALGGCSATGGTRPEPSAGCCSVALHQVRELPLAPKIPAGRKASSF